MDQNRRDFFRSALALMLSALVVLMPAQAWGAGSALQVTIPNGYANLAVTDLGVSSTAGQVRWTRAWDGQEWKFNPQWESLSQSWKNLTGSQSADTTGGTLSSGGGALASGGSGGSGGGVSGCWVWADEDWSPSTGALINGVLDAGPLLPERSTPFNRFMGDTGNTDYAPTQPLSVDYASLCAGSGGALRDTEGIRRANELYLGESGRYAFNNRSILEKRAVRQIPGAAAAALYASLGAGSITLAPELNAKGYRWIDKAGEWIDYNTQGQVVAWGDKNDNTVWLVRDTEGLVRGVVDANGRVLYSLHYNGRLIAEVRDYPVAGLSADLPARSLKYYYDARNRLEKVTDARGYDTWYAYDIGNRIVKITDQQGREEAFAYSGAVVTRRTAPDGAVTDYAFDYDDTNKQFSSKITAPQTAAGRRVTDLTHSRVGKLVRRIVNGRIDEEVRYDTGARAQIHTNARGFTTRITRNEFDQVVEVLLPDGATQKSSYSALHLGLTEDTDEMGFKTQYQYDARGNLSKMIEAVGTVEERVTEYQVNSLGQASQVTRKGRTEVNGSITPDATWKFDYDALGQIKKTTDPENNDRLYRYNRNGRLVSATDPLGNSTNYEVDADGNLSKVTDALARSTSYQYDKVGNLIQATDARGKSVLMAYDAMNRGTQITNRVGGKYQAQYNAEGLPTLQTNEDNRPSYTEFDNFLRLTKQTDALGNVTELGYTIPDGTGSGTLGSLYGPSDIKFPSFRQTQRYDARERATNGTTFNPNGQGTESLGSSAEYDKLGRILNVTNANGKTGFFAYDVLGRASVSTDNMGNKTRAQYDVRGNLIQLTDALGNVSKFEIDRNNRTLGEALPMGQSTRYSYDKSGRPKEYTDPNGQKSTYGFDAANRLLEIKQYQGGTVLARSTSFTWDDNNNLSGWSDVDATRPAGQQTSSATYTYDDANRRTGQSVSYPNPQGGSASLSYGYQYSLAGYKTQLTWADGSKIDYGYSQHGQLESVTIPGEGSISVNQFKWAAPTKVTLPGGTTQAYTLDGLLKPEGLAVKTPGQQTVLSLSHSFGKLQELKTSSRTDTSGNLSSTRNSSYSYDDETRLTQAGTDSGGLFGTDTETFTLDAVGNRIAHSRVSGAWVFDGNNRLTQAGTGASATSYEYDAAGNLSKKTGPGGKVTQYAYDTQNRLVQVKDGANQLIARYGYDPMSRRIWREQYRDRDGNALVSAKRSTYLYADEGLIAETSQDITLNADQSVSASASPTISAQYGPQPDSEFTTGVLFVKTKNSNGQDSFAYYHRDQLGTPIQATDKAGNVVWAASYNVFGQATITTPTATADKPTIGSNLRFPGQYEDAETGLHYNWHRYYDSSTGRYITQDPIGLNGGINTYAYVGGNPAAFVDPGGLLFSAAYALNGMPMDQAMAAGQVGTVAAQLAIGVYAVGAMGVAAVPGRAVLPFVGGAAYGSTSAMWGGAAFETICEAAWFSGRAAQMIGKVQGPLVELTGLPLWAVRGGLWTGANSAGQWLLSGSVDPSLVVATGVGGAAMTWAAKMAGVLPGGTGVVSVAIVGVTMASIFSGYFSRNKAMKKQCGCDNPSSGPAPDKGWNPSRDFRMMDPNIPGRAPYPSDRR